MRENCVHIIEAPANFVECFQNFFNRFIDVKKAEQICKRPFQSTFLGKTLLEQYAK